jgi:DNA repair exonuclease SbcCD ATPase subunit
VTQQANSKGEIAEGFSIVVRDEKGERDVSLCSGGETQILQAANRIGLALWLSQLRGVPCETLIFDEAANNIDDEGTEAFVRAIQRVAHRFALIVLITPKAEMARLVPQRIELEPQLRGVKVSYIGATAPAAESAA